MQLSTVALFFFISSSPIFQVGYGLVKVFIYPNYWEHSWNSFFIDWNCQLNMDDLHISNGKENREENA